jgi:hypothetical protein
MNCTAKRSNGTPCKNPAIRGGNVCRNHGGSAPQVRAKANERLLALVDPALATLARGVAKREGIPGPTEIAAARDILDRAGFKPTDKTELTGPDGGPIEHVVKVRLVKSGARE